jgi:hypothetical protein
VWPDNPALLRRLVELLQYVEYQPDDLIGKMDADKPTAATCKLYLSCAIISDVVKLPYSEHNALKAKDPIEDLAHELKVKLPAGWADPLKPPKPLVEKATAEELRAKKAILDNEEEAKARTLRSLDRRNSIGHTKPAPKPAKPKAKAKK